MKMRGKIYNKPAYDQSKHLDHSGYEFERHISPSDIDMVIDAAGWIMFVELQSQYDTWVENSRRSRGQYTLYYNLVHSSSVSKCRHVAVLYHHCVPDTREIQTVSDCKSFDVMYYDPASDEMMSTEPINGSKWKEFAELWVKSPGEAFSRFMKATT